MSTSYLGQVHNKIFDKTSHKQIKIFTVITQKTLCHLQVIKFNYLLI